MWTFTAEILRKQYSFQSQDLYLRPSDQSISFVAGFGLLLSAKVGPFHIAQYPGDLAVVADKHLGLSFTWSI